MANLKNRSLLTLLDFSPSEIHYLLNLSLELKKAKYNKTEIKHLIGKNIALIFEKDSTRTRCAFEVAAFDQGAHVTYIGAQGSQMGKKETVKDTARVLGRMYDGIEFRGYSQQAVEELAKYSGRPVWNGLTDLYHPTQVLADLLTIMEYKNLSVSGNKKEFKDIKLAYVGDGRNNVANSLMIGSSKMGIDFRLVTPNALFPDKSLVTKAKNIANETGAKITITDNIKEGVSEVDVIYTDVWVSMGENNWEERINLLKPFQVNEELVAHAKKDYIFMHCLPAFHNTDTTIGEEVYQKFGVQAMEVTESVFESKNSVVFDQAENRLHTIKAVMVATLAD